MTLEELNGLLKSGKTITVSKGTGPLSFLTIAFIVLKLLGYISWSWWWVLAPVWIPIALVLVLFIIGILVIIGISAFEAKKKVSTTVTKDNNSDTTTSKKKTTRSKKAKANGENTEKKD